jgi:putative tricarboxylic transport membrane protein
MRQQSFFFTLLWAMLLATLSLPSAAQTLHLLIPGAAGGGWDRTARATGEALTKTGLVENVSFENMSGGGGGKALAHLIEKGRPTTLMVNSTPIVVRSLQRVFPQSFRDLTPVASVIGDYSVIAVRSASPFETLDELAQAMRLDSRAIAVGGGSVSGGTDHIVTAMIFSVMGTPSREIKYIPYDAGGKAMGGLLSGEVQALSTGYGEVVDLLEQGYVRLLCVASKQRLEFIASVPTCHEAGATDTFFVNWRGFFAAPNIPQKDIAKYQTLLKNMQDSSAWEALRARYGWVNLFNAGDDFTALLENQETQLTKLLTELDLL